MSKQSSFIKTLTDRLTLTVLQSNTDRLTLTVLQTNKQFRSNVDEFDLELEMFHTNVVEKIITYKIQGLHQSNTSYLF